MAWVTPVFVHGATLFSPCDTDVESDFCLGRGLFLFVYGRFVLFCFVLRSLVFDVLRFGLGFPFLFFSFFFFLFFSFLFPVLAAGSDAKVDGRWCPLKCGYDNMLWALGYRSHVHQKGPLNNA